MIDSDSAKVSSSSKDNVAIIPWGAKFGVFVGRAAINETYSEIGPTFNLANNWDNPNIANLYGVNLYRMTINEQAWDNIDPTKRTNLLHEYSNADIAGFSIALNVNYLSAGQIGNLPTPQQYEDFLKSVLSTLSSYQYTRPAYIAVENEEPGIFGNLTTDPPKYRDELNRGISVCTNYPWYDGSTSTIPVINGGLTVRMLTYLTWDWLKINDPSVAQTFARNSMPPSSYYSRDLYQTGKPSWVVAEDPTKIIDQINLGNTLIGYYQTQTPGISNVNFHWYEPVSVRGWDENKDGVHDPIHNILRGPYDAIPDGWGVDPNKIAPSALSNVMSYLHTKFPNNYWLISNETGQLTTNYCLTLDLFKTLTTYMTVGGISGGPNHYLTNVCWLDADGGMPYTAKSLHNTSSNNINFMIRTGTGTYFKQDCGTLNNGSLQTCGN